MKMSDADISIIVYMNPNKSSLIHCPKCHFLKNIDISKFRNISNNLNIRCRCGHVFECHINFREFDRKPVSLSGEYVNLTNGERGDITIRDISLGGIGFSNARPHSLKPADTLKLQFSLDNGRHSRICQKATVRSVQDRFVGVEFQDQMLADELNLYLSS